ncbi:MAG TPA: hypothetical protein VME92_03465 [Acetobacteraceae bacterium]|nr:hypothetical protein [Acetobacteraceae bacterium]
MSVKPVARSAAIIAFPQHRIAIARLTAEDEAAARAWEQAVRPSAYVQITFSRAQADGGSSALIYARGELWVLRRLADRGGCYGLWRRGERQPAGRFMSLTSALTALQPVSVRAGTAAQGAPIASTGRGCGAG